MSALSQLQRASFDSIAFPVRKVTIQGGLRDHVHEYPKTPGGAAEKLGRKLYVIKMTAPFLDCFPQYGAGLYPGDLADLRDRFEQGLTSDLVVPQIGTIKAYCFNWTQDLEAKQQSGEVVELEFREDQSNASLIETLVNLQSKDLSVVAASMGDEADALGIGDVFDSITSAIGQITGLVDQIDLFASLILAKLDNIIGLFTVLDTTVLALQDPSNQAFIESFLAAWKASVDLQSNLLKIATPVVRFVVPSLMSISQVATLRYGDASRAADLLSLNALADAYAIPAGTVMKVWAS